MISRSLRDLSFRYGPMLFFTALVGLLWFRIPQASATDWENPSSVHPQREFDDLFPRLARTADGQVWIFWLGVDPVEQDDEIFFSRWNGDGWEAASTVNPPNGISELSPAVSTSPDGGLWVIWLAPNPAVAGAYMGLASHWAGSGWSIPDTLWRQAPRISGRAVAAVSQTEAWFARDGISAYGSSDVFVYHEKDGALEPEFQFIQPGLDEVDPTIAVDPSGNVWAAWVQLLPLDPDATPLQFSRRVNGAWAVPERIAQPTAVLVPRLSVDSSGSPWIITLADAPNLWPLAAEAWAIRWSESGWETPIRLSFPILPQFTLQSGLSVSDEPGTDPVAIWVSRYAFSTTRADLLYSRWTGTTWTAPELAGSLADSAIVHSPDIVRDGSRLWVTYTRGVGTHPFVQNVFSVRSVEPRTFSDSVDFSARVLSTGVLVSWSMKVQQTVESFQIRRESGPNGAIIIAALTGQRSRSGSTLDHPISPGQYSYWLDLQLAGGGEVSVGPRTVDIGQPTREARPWRIAANSRFGTVTLRGRSRSRTIQKLIIFNVSGRPVRSLSVNSTPEGDFEVTWDGRTDSAAYAPSGVYFAQVIESTGSQSDRTKFVLLK